MENLLFCLNATIPVFLLMILGYLFMRIGIFDEAFAKKMNSFVFKVALPVLVFQDLAAEDFYKVWDGKYVLFCFIVTVLSIAVSALVAFLTTKDQSQRAEMIQASFRSSAALLGIGFIQNIYGNSGMAPLMIIGCVPLYNITAVAVLESFKPVKGGKDKKELAKETLIGILTNPIILGIVIGIIWSLLKIPRPVIFNKTVKYIAGLATPLGLMALGASFDFKKAKAAALPAFVSTFMKLVVFVAIFLPLAVRLGYQADRLIAVLVMLGSPTTVSCFIMARSLGHEGTVSSATVMLTTFFSAFTLTGWLYVLKVFGLV